MNTCINIFQMVHKNNNLNVTYFEIQYLSIQFYCIVFRKGIINFVRNLHYYADV